MTCDSAGISSNDRAPPVNSPLPDNGKMDGSDHCLSPAFGLRSAAAATPALFALQRETLLSARERGVPLSRPPPAPSGGRRSVHAGQRDGCAEDVPTRRRRLSVIDPPQIPNPFKQQAKQNKKNYPRRRLWIIRPINKQNNGWVVCWLPLTFTDATKQNDGDETWRLWRIW